MRERQPRPRGDLSKIMLAIFGLGDCESTGSRPLPAPPAEKATTRQDQTRKTSAGERTGDPSYEAEIIFGLQHLTGSGKMLIVRPEARLFRVSTSEIGVEGIATA